MTTFLSLFDKKWLILVLAFIAFIWAIAAARLLFPFYSVNNDEPVYVLQAEALAEGKLYLSPHKFDERFFNTWLLLRRGDKITFKYTPVHAAFLTLGQHLFGSMRMSLGIIAAANILLVYWFTQEVYKNYRLALASALFVLLSPFFLIQSATFLSYTTFLLLGLLFAALFLRGTRLNLPFLLILDGLSLGLAFFARPYDAVLFSIPFGLLFAQYLWLDFRRHISQGVWLVLGFLPMLGLVLAYNNFLAGNPFQFPYLQDPLDGVGFGPRRFHPLAEIIDYNLTLALESAITSLLELNYWVFGGPILLTLMVFYLIKQHIRWQETSLMFLGLLFPVGHLFVYGVYNLVYFNFHKIMGPVYYMPVLIPVSVLGARGLQIIFRHQKKFALSIALLMFLVNSGLLLGQITTNYSFTLRNRAVYRPFLEKQLKNSLVFVPPVWGPVLLHPFAYLRNPPSLDGPVIYALNRGRKNLTLFQAYSGRTFYRFDVKSAFTDDLADNFFGLVQIAHPPPETDLVELFTIRDDALSQSLRIVNPTDSPYVYTYVWNNELTETYLLDNASHRDREYEIEWRIRPEAIEFKGEFVEKKTSLPGLSSDRQLAVAVAFCDKADRSTQNIFEYRYDFNLTADNQIEILFPPEEWHNPLWPDESGWRMEEIDAVLKNR
jgi:4-amino-4-deoxy-L-arabinose transferase-like glycosyltransferase